MDGSLSEESGVRMVALFDHEEVGSNSAQGAGSPAMFDALSRITKSFDSSDPRVPCLLLYLFSLNYPHKSPVFYFNRYSFLVFYFYP